MYITYMTILKSYFMITMRYTYLLDTREISLIEQDPRFAGSFCVLEAPLDIILNTASSSKQVTWMKLGTT